MLIASQLSEVGPRRSSYSAGVALGFELCHYDQAANDPQAAVQSCAFTPRSILSEIKQRNLLNRRITGYAPGWSALTLGLVRCEKLSGLTLEAQEVWMPLVASQPGQTSVRCCGQDRRKRRDARRRRPCLDYHLLPAPDGTGYHSQDGSSCAANPGYRLALIAERPSGAKDA